MRFVGWVWLVAGCTSEGKILPTQAPLTASDPPQQSAPIALNDAISVPAGGEVAHPVTSNDTDEDGDLDPDSVEVGSPPVHGTLLVGSNGEVTYAHGGGSEASDQFTYTVADAEGNRSTEAIVTITIQQEAADLPPVATDDLSIVTEGGTVNIDPLANDTDDGGLDPASLTLTGVPAQRGTVTLRGDGTLDYAHDGSEGETDTFEYQIADVNGHWSNIASVELHVLPVDDPTVARDDFAMLEQGGQVNVEVALNDEDPDGALDLASVEILTQPQWGLATPQSDGSVQYTHDGSLNTSDVFTYRISNTVGLPSNEATVTMTATAPLDCGPVVLDPAFGGDGTVNLVAPGTDYDDGTYAVALQADGSLVLGGRYYRNAYGRTASLSRVGATGALDLTFGGDGFADGLFTVDSSVYGLAVQPDGRILAGGASQGQLLVFRLESNGTFDLTFGVGGVVTVPSVSVHYDAHAMLALQPDGRILAAGYDGADFQVVRLLDDGSLDPSFGTAGIATIDLGGVDTAYTLLLQPDGFIVVAGTSSGDFGLVRLDAAGIADGTFGAGGVVTADITGADDQAYGIALQGDDLVAVGCGDCTFDYLYDTGFALARFLPDGSPDLGFGTNGTVFDPIPSTLLGGTGLNDRAYAVAALSGGAVLVVGQSQWNDSFGRMLVARYLSDGTLDPCFDTDGYYTQDVWDVFSQGDAANAVLVQADGSFVLAGTVNPSAAGYEAVLRTLP